MGGCKEVLCAVFCLLLYGAAAVPLLLWNRGTAGKRVGDADSGHTEEEVISSSIVILWIGSSPKLVQGGTYSTIVSIARLLAACVLLS